MQMQTTKYGPEHSGSRGMILRQGSGRITPNVYELKHSDGVDGLDWNWVEQGTANQYFAAGVERHSLLARRSLACMT